jgi:hypothetical protein
MVVAVSMQVPEAVLRPAAMAVTADGAAGGGGHGGGGGPVVVAARTGGGGGGEGIWVAEAGIHASTPCVLNCGQKKGGITPIFGTSPHFEAFAPTQSKAMMRERDLTTVARSEFRFYGFNLVLLFLMSARIESRTGEGMFSLFNSAWSLVA